MRSGIVVLGVFAALWAIAGLALAGADPAWLAVPVLVSAAIVTLAWRGGAARTPGPHVGKVVAIWSAVEGVAMFVAANVLINLHMRDALMPVFAIIVGLHFLPLARGIPVRFYYATGAALVLVGIVGLVAAPAHLQLMTGLAAAAILWASAVALARGAA